LGNWAVETRSGTNIAHRHSVKFGRCELTVHRHVDYPAGQWLLSCHRLGIELVPLASKASEAAKSEAVRYTLDYLREHTAALRAVPLERRLPRCVRTRARHAEAAAKRGDGV
jgi:hypothetical protein